MISRMTAVLSCFLWNMETVVWEFRMKHQRRMVHMLNLRVIGQERNNLLGVLNVTLDPQRQSLSALQQQKCVERRNGSTSICLLYTSRCV